jgi:predicted site-specific integrase-resolvase
MSDSPVHTLLLKPVEAARELRVTAQTLANWRHSGMGPPFVKLGAAVRYRYDAVVAFVEANSQTPKARATGGAR